MANSRSKNFNDKISFGDTLLIYKRLYKEGKFARDSQPWKRMNEISDMMINRVKKEVQNKIEKI